MPIVVKPTWFQREVSPWVTGASAIIYQNRKEVAWGIRILARDLNERERVILREVLNERKLLKRKYRRANLETLQHFHISIKATTSKLAQASQEFFRRTEREEFRDFVPEMTSDKIRERIFYREPVAYHRRLSAVMPRLLKGQAVDEGREEWLKKVIQHAFDLAVYVSRVEEDELLYRIEKMQGMGADVQAIVASLFMDLLPSRVEKFLSRSQNQGLRELAPSVSEVIRRYQFMRESFGFDRTQMVMDKEYVYRKMSELIQGIEAPESMLLFFLHKLQEVRKANKEEKHSIQVFNEIRFFYAPLAERLRLVFLADDFRDQYLRLGNSSKYDFICEKVEEQTGMDYDAAKKFLKKYARKISSLLEERLGKDFQKVTIKFRVKSPYSIWNKVEVREKYEYGELPDILGIKVICDSKENLMKISEILEKSGLLKVKPDGVKRKLGEEEGQEHKKVKWRGIRMQGEETEQQRPVEIQVMTQEMNAENTLGKAADWMYNLKKELSAYEAQVITKHEPKEVMTLNYFINFIKIKNFWTARMEVPPPEFSAASTF